MLNPNLYRRPVLLDTGQHQALRLPENAGTLRCAEGVNVVFITLSEFEAVCKEYPILFVPAGEDSLGRSQVAPVAVMGFQEGENLFLRTGRTGKPVWRARYVPAVLRLYPFATMQIDQRNWGVCIDEAWTGWSTTKGRRLFDAEGRPSEFTSRIHAELGLLEAEVAQTRTMGERLMRLGLLHQRRFNVSLPDGTSYAVEGLLTLDEKKLEALPKLELANLHRAGVLHCLSAHRISLTNLQALAETRWLASQKKT